MFCTCPQTLQSGTPGMSKSGCYGLNTCTGCPMQEKPFRSWQGRICVLWARRSFGNGPHYAETPFMLTWIYGSQVYGIYLSIWQNTNNPPVDSYNEHNECLWVCVFSRNYKVLKVFSFNWLLYVVLLSAAAWMKDKCSAVDTKTTGMITVRPFLTLMKASLR